MCMCAKSLQPCVTLSDPMDCSTPGSSAHGMLQAKNWRVCILGGGKCPPPRDFPDPGIKPVSLTSPALGGGFFTTSDTWEAHVYLSDQISRSVVSDSLRPHESQHARPPCPSPTPGVHSDSRPSSQWFHPAGPILVSLNGMLCPYCPLGCWSDIS